MTEGLTISQPMLVRIGQLEIGYLIDGSSHEGKTRELIALSPDIGVQYFRDVATIVNAGGPSLRSQLFVVMTRYGLVPAPPRS